MLFTSERLSEGSKESKKRKEEKESLSNYGAGVTGRTGGDPTFEKSETRVTCDHFASSCSGQPTCDGQVTSKAAYFVDVLLIHDYIALCSLQVCDMILRDK